PYYAMERVSGCTLATVIHVLGEADRPSLKGADLERVVREHSAEGFEGASPLFEGTWERVCLRIARELAEALEHAHRRGIAHRDVKPSNVMLTPSGRVQLFDFGLSAASAELPGTPGQAVDGEAIERRLTRHSSQLGTLAYMAPELLRGEGSDNDSALDIYSLGTTLFELLALELPYSDENLLRQAADARREAPQLRERAPWLSWEADALCNVALQPDPANRYASADDFARDLGHALTGRPLLARPAGPIRRVRRWVRRRPAVASLAAVVVAALVVGPTGFGLQQRTYRLALAEQKDVIAGQRDALEVALDDAQLQEERAERNFGRAREAVDTMLTRLGDEELRDAPRLHRLRRRVLEDALEFYEGLLEERTEDTELLRESALAWMRVGDLRGMLDESDAAAAAYGEALARLSDPALVDTVEAGVDRSSAASSRARALRIAGRVEEADTQITEAIQAAESLYEAHPNHSAVARSRADLLVEQAEQLKLKGQKQASLDLLAATIAGLEPSLQKDPHQPELVSLLAKAHNRAASTLIEGAIDFRAVEPAELEAALGHHEQALALLPPALERNPESARLKHQLARAHLNRGTLRMGTGDFPAALTDLDLAVAGLDGLCTDFPEVDTYLADRGIAGLSRGNARVQQGDVDGGVASIRGAIADFDVVARANPDLAENQLRLGGAQLQLADIVFQLARDPRTAQTLVDQAIESLSMAAGGSPAAPGATQWLGIAYERRCQILIAGAAWLDLIEAAQARAARFDDPEAPASSAYYLALGAEQADSMGDAELSEQLDLAAAALVEQALERGFDPALFAQDPVWQPLIARGVLGSDGSAGGD
ncbi:MAG: serine/threonine-protein kinase, partial [Planctomycetota bacterium]